MEALELATWSEPPEHSICKGKDCEHLKLCRKLAEQYGQIQSVCKSCRRMVRMYREGAHVNLRNVWKVWDA